MYDLLGCIPKSFGRARAFPGAISYARELLHLDRGIVLVVVILLSGCSQPSEPQSTSGQSRMVPGDRPSDGLENKAWAEASRARTAAAITTYLEHYGSGGHAEEARQRLSALEEQARKDEEKKAWADAFRAGTAAALREYLQHHEAGVHAADARQRLSVLEKLELWDEEKQAWDDAARVGTPAAIKEFLQHHGSGAHAVQARQRLLALEREARWQEENTRAEASRAGIAAPITTSSQQQAPTSSQQQASASPQQQAPASRAAAPRPRLSTLEEQPPKKVEAPRKPTASATNMRPVDIRKTCQISSNAIGLTAGSGTEDACIKSEQAAHDDIVKQWSEFSTAEKASCIRPNVYLPSYVEWLTCLEMRRDVRKLNQRHPG